MERLPTPGEFEIKPTITPLNPNMNIEVKDPKKTNLTSLQVAPPNSFQAQPQKFPCDECSVQCSSMKSLRTHKLIHSGGKRFKCLTCNVAFTRQDNLNAHQVVHSNLKPFECKECGRRYARAESLRIHQRNHTGVRPYVCATCCKAFTRRDKLVLHERVHTQEKPYACSICDKRFSRKDRVKRHEAIHLRALHKYGDKMTTPVSSKASTATSMTSTSKANAAVSRNTVQPLIQAEAPIPTYPLPFGTAQTAPFNMHQLNFLQGPPNPFQWPLSRSIYTQFAPT